MKGVLLLAMILIGALAAAAWPSAAPPHAFATGETCSPARPQPSGTTVKSLVSGGLTRSYRVHVPASYTGASPVPVVFSFHGHGSNAIEQEVYSGFSAKSDSAGFIAVFPDGVPPSPQGWNAWQFAPPQPDDVAFTSAIIDSLIASSCIDQSRVYTSGISNGAMMSVRLACSLSSRIAAFAPVAGAYYAPMSLNLNPAETCPDTAPRPMIAFHGTADPTVPFNGGGSSIVYRLPIDDNTPAEDVLSDWAAHNGCGGTRQESQIGTEVRLVQYGSCANGAVVELYAVDGGGHTWPGSFDVPSLGYTTHQISATDLIWSFFSNYTLPDADGDLIPDVVDNCPTVANYGQTNYDRNLVNLHPAKPYDDLTRANSDLLGDACDPDIDNDGLSNTDELNLGPGGSSHALCPGATAATDPSKEDTDGDRYLDGAECALGTDPTNPASKPATADCGPSGDADGDGVRDVIEICFYDTNPQATNTDGDGCGDAKEIASVDGNLTVNSTDLQQIATAFGPSTNPGYILDFDMDKNGTINSTDLQFAASHFGACP